MVTSSPGRELLAHVVDHDPSFRDRTAESLRAVEKRLLDCSTGAPDPRVAELTGHLAAAGGKRLRPLLVLLGAEFGEPWRDGVVDTAVVAELVHISSLYHDDVMDGADLRHGVESVNARWGARLAVAGGNWLLARAARLAAELGPDMVRFHADVASDLVVGQLREMTGPGEGEDPVHHFFQVTAGKTAALLSMAAAAGALRGGAPAAHGRALAEYGRQLGIAFQISDDLLDLAAPTALIGKEQGKDLAAGVLSLPVILAVADRSPANAELRGLLANGPLTDPGDRHRALELFAASAAPAAARGHLRLRLDRAGAALDPLPPGPAREALHALCAYVDTRVARTVAANR
ncbi:MULTISPECIES: polyprenyl synthetase family protein [unclassified Streptomyces]|uniref:polyprenyl synthetase family protein n=1 Tax=unclassified Streptomyces TaxID=2593676 RepID=UPI0009398CED|nr:MULTISPECIES: polyprenyl synthetase family protein [unclassified Streptomyces]